MNDNPLNISVDNPHEKEGEIQSILFQYLCDLIPSYENGYEDLLIAFSDYQKDLNRKKTIPLEESYLNVHKFISEIMDSGIRIMALELIESDPILQSQSETYNRLLDFMIYYEGVIFPNDIYAPHGTYIDILFSQPLFPLYLKKITDISNTLEFYGHNIENSTITYHLQQLYENLSKFYSSSLDERLNLEIFLQRLGGGSTFSNWMVKILQLNNYHPRVRALAEKSKDLMKNMLTTVAKSLFEGFDMEVLLDQVHKNASLPKLQYIFDILFVNQHTSPGGYYSETVVKVVENLVSEIPSDDYRLGFLLQAREKYLVQNNNDT